MRQILISCLLCVLFGLPAHAEEPLVTDIDDHLVAITAGFTGTELLVFGATQRAGDVVIVVHGPKQDIVVRRKDRIGGIWVNTDALTFEHVPAFYHMATTAQTLDNLAPSALRRHTIGVENIRLKPMEDIDPDEERAFSEAIIRNKVAIGHYSAEPGVVERRGGRLFRSTILIPTNVPVGTYTIETLLIDDGRVIGAQATPLFVNKEGIGAQVFRAAHDYPMPYGIMAVLIAAFFGLAANWIFKKI